MIQTRYMDISDLSDEEKMDQFKRASVLANYSLCNMLELEHYQCFLLHILNLVDSLNGLGIMAFSGDLENFNKIRDEFFKKINVFIKQHQEIAESINKGINERAN